MLCFLTFHLLPHPPRCHRHHHHLLGHHHCRRRHLPSHLHPLPASEKILLSMLIFVLNVGWSAKAIACFYIQRNVYGCI